jgi:prepilin peptidase CpaA
MVQSFFPGPVFGWTFYGTLVGLTAVAAFTDLRRMIVPKWLTLTALALGVVFNLIRGAWLGAQGQEVWLLGENGVVVGVLDGLLFSLSGFLLGFAIFFLMWILGTCGGGDVKLFAALGSWVGTYLALLVLSGTLVVVFLISLVRVLGVFRRRGLMATVANHSARRKQRLPGGPPKKPRPRLLSYSLPVAVVTALVLLWAFRVDLHLVPARQAASNKVATHAG